MNTLYIKVLSLRNFIRNKIKIEVGNDARSSFYFEVEGYGQFKSIIISYQIPVYFLKILWSVYDYVKQTKQVQGR